MSLRGVLWAMSVLCLSAGLGLGGRRVAGLERHELEREGRWTPLAATPGANGAPEPHRSLTTARLERGEEVTFEVCTQDRLDAKLWRGVVDFAVWDPIAQQLVLRAPLDRTLLARAKRSSRGSCIVLARSAALAAGGTLAIEVVWPGRTLPAAVRGTPLRGRILARRPLAPSNRIPVGLVLLGALLGLAALTRWRRSREPPPADIAAPTPSTSPPAAPSSLAADSTASTRPPSTPSSQSVPSRSDPPPPLASESATRALTRVGAGLAILLLAGTAIAFVPIGGATAALFRGLLLAAVQVLAAALLVHAARRERAAALGMTRPTRALIALGLAPVIGVGLFYLGGLAARAIPSTGEAPVEAIVSWPSGTLAVALIAVVVPIAEELFFRGFLYGTLARRFGEAVAFVATVLLFALAHLPQEWGAFGSLASIFIAGVGFTALRWWTGSSLAPTLAHLAHNTLIVALTLGATAVR